MSGKVHSYLQIKVSQPTRYMIMPDGTQAIFLSPDKTLLGGAHSHSFEIGLSNPGIYFGVRFFPGALHHFFNVNLSEISNEFADYKYLQCSGFQYLSEQVYSNNGFNQRVKICEQWLLQNFKPTPATICDIALRRIYDTRGDIKVSALAKSVDCSDRHLNRQFLHYTGVNTKTFIQIVRIQNVYKQRYLNSTAHLETILDVGYSDQSHFLNAAKKMISSQHRLFFNRIKSDFCNI